MYAWLEDNTKKELQDNPNMYPSVLTNIDLIFFKIVHHTFHIKI
jgi:hypothetical protein